MASAEEDDHEKTEIHERLVEGNIHKGEVMATESR
jgi:hypothetical protein